MSTKFVPDFTITTGGAVHTPLAVVTEQGVGPAQNVWPPNEGSVTTGQAYWTQADWYVDWVNGFDGADGKTPATAVKTVMGGVAARWGTISPILSQTTTLHILTSQPVGAENIVLAPVISGPVLFEIIGTRQPVASFALGAVTAKNRATNAQFSAHGFLHPNVAVNQLVENTTAGKASVCLIQALTGGGDIATLSQPLVDVTAGATDLFEVDTVEVDTWAVTDTVTVWDLPVLNLWSLLVSGGGPGSVGTKWPGLWLQNISVPDPIIALGDTSIFTPSNVNGYMLIADSVLMPYLKVGQPGAFTRFANTFMLGGQFGDDVRIFGGIIDSYGALMEGENDQIDADVMLTAASFNQCNGRTTALGLVNCLGTIEVNGQAYAFSSYNGNTPQIWGAGLAIDVAPDACFENPPRTWASLFPGGASLTLATVGTGTFFTPGAPGSFTSGVALTPANLDTHGSLFDPARGAYFTNL